MANQNHALHWSQTRLIGELLHSARPFRLWSTANRGVGLIWRSRTGVTCAAFVQSERLCCFRAMPPIDNWARGGINGTTAEDSARYARDAAAERFADF